jgi:hydrogenase-4 component E
MTTPTYTTPLNLAAAALLLCAAGIVGGRHQVTSLRLLRAQGVALAAIPVIGGAHRHDVRLVAVGIAVGVLRAGVLPRMISRLMSSEPGPEPTPAIGTALALLMTGALTVLAYAVSRPLVALDPGPATRAAPVALAVVLAGVLALTTRRRAASQVVGFLVLDNGIAGMAFLLTSGLPVVVELGASLDLLLVVGILAALTARMRVKFGGTDLAELQELHE